MCHNTILLYSYMIVNANMEKETMKIEYRIRILAGTLVLISLALAHFVSPLWLILAAFVGLNLIQSAFTSFCPAEIIMKKLWPKAPR